MPLLHPILARILEPIPPLCASNAPKSLSAFSTGGTTKEEAAALEAAGRGGGCGAFLGAPSLPSGLSCGALLLLTKPTGCADSGLSLSPLWRPRRPPDRLSSESSSESSPKMPSIASSPFRRLRPKRGRPFSSSSSSEDSMSSEIGNIMGGDVFSFPHRGQTKAAIVCVETRVLVPHTNTLMCGVLWPTHQQEPAARSQQAPARPVRTLPPHITARNSTQIYIRSALSPARLRPE